MISIAEYLQDFDNEELDAEEWTEQMGEAVDQYNNDYGATWTHRSALNQYQAWKFIEQKLDQ